MVSRTKAFSPAPADLSRSPTAFPALRQSRLPHAISARRSISLDLDQAWLTSRHRRDALPRTRRTDSELDEFYEDLMNNVRARAEIDKTTPSRRSWSRWASGLMTPRRSKPDAGALRGTGTKGRKLAVSGYDLDDSDGSVALAVLDFEDTRGCDPGQSLSARQHSETLEKYRGGGHRRHLPGGPGGKQPEVQLAEDLRHRGRTVTQVPALPAQQPDAQPPRPRTSPAPTIGGIPVEYHVWDVERLYRLHESNRGREALDIDLT